MDGPAEADVGAIKKSKILYDFDKLLTQLTFKVTGESLLLDSLVVFKFVTAAASAMQCITFPR